MWVSSLFQALRWKERGGSNNKRTASSGEKHILAFVVRLQAMQKREQHAVRRVSECVLEMELGECVERKQADGVLFGCVVVCEAWWVDEAVHGPLRCRCRRGHSVGRVAVRVSDCIQLLVTRRSKTFISPQKTYQHLTMAVVYPRYQSHPHSSQHHPPTPPPPRLNVSV